MYDLKKTMDRLISREVESGRVKGASALVLHRGKELYYNAFGYADEEKGYLMKRDTIIHLYSMSKPITSAAVMILAERGELDLKDPVSEYLPCFEGQKVWVEGTGEVSPDRKVTVFDLLNMTSGIVYPGELTEPGRRMKQILDPILERMAAGERVDTQEVVKGIASVPLCFQPGAEWQYGFSADVLGGIVEAVSGKRFGRFLKEELFEPLDMKDTGFFVPQSKRERRAQRYMEAEDGNLVPFEGSHLGEYYGEDVAFESGGAGLVSTLDDYAHFASMLAHKGIWQGRRILGPKTVAFMAQNHLSGQQQRTFNWDALKGYGYGCLMRVLTDQTLACESTPPGEFGWDGWTGNYMSVSMQEDLVFLYFMQRCGAGTTPFVRRLKMAAYGATVESE